MTKETQEMPLHDSESTYVYTYDDSGNVTLKLWYQNLTGTGEIYNQHYYEYDEYNQLIAEGWEYEWGNKTDVTYENEYDSNSRLIRQSSLSSSGYAMTYEYDNNGNLLLKRVSSEDGSYEYRYEYDEMDCMIRETYINRDTNQVTTYTYGYIYTFE